MNPLDAAIIDAVAHGWRVEHRDQTSAVIASGSPCNHVLHLLITVLMCGLWAPIWLVIAATSGTKRRVLVVDQYGTVLERRPERPAASGWTIAAGAILAIVVIWFVAVAAASIH